MYDLHLWLVDCHHHHHNHNTRNGPVDPFYSILIRLLEPSSSEAGETWVNFAHKTSFHARKVLLHAVNLRHGTDSFTSPPKEVVLRIFITLKNPSSSAEFELANLGSSGKHGTTRPLVDSILLKCHLHIWSCQGCGAVEEYRKFVFFLNIVGIFRQRRHISGRPSLTR
jgi:hypothetical protein